jgi:hypothetical protein
MRSSPRACKKNVYVVFATQEVADATSKPELLSTILSACHTKIFLPDEEARAPAMMQAYQAIGLTTAEIDILAKAQKKRDYYYRSVKGRRLFELGLGPAALAFVGASSEKDQHFFDEMLRCKPPAEYARAMLDRRGVAWAAAEMERSLPKVVTETPPPDPLTTDAETIRISVSHLQNLVAETDEGEAVTIPIPRAVPPPLPRPTLRLRKKVAQ